MKASEMSQLVIEAVARATKAYEAKVISQRQDVIRNGSGTAQYHSAINNMRAAAWILDNIVQELLRDLESQQAKRPEGVVMS